MSCLRQAVTPAATLFTVLFCLTCHAHAGVQTHQYQPMPRLMDLMDLPFIAQGINFVLLLILLTLMLRKPLATLVKNRSQNIERGIHEAERLQTEAQQAQQNYLARIEQLDAEIQQLKAQLIYSAERECRDMLDRAQAKIRRLQADADLKIEHRIHEEVIRIRRELIATALAGAQRIIGERVGVADDKRLAEQMLVQLRNQGTSATHN